MMATIDLALNNFFHKTFVLGQGNLPLSGPVVLAPTHRSRWDALMLTMAAGRRVSQRDCRYMVTLSEMKGLQGWFLNRLGCFAINQKKPSLLSLRYAIDLLIEGEQLVVFPEGRINRNRKPIKLQQGLFRISQLASRSVFEVQVVPVGLGYSEGMPKPFGLAALCFESPIKISYQENMNIDDFNLELIKRMHSAEEAALNAVGRFN